MPIFVIPRTISMWETESEAAVEDTATDHL